MLVGCIVDRGYRTDHSVPSTSKTIPFNGGAVEETLGLRGANRVCGFEAMVRGKRMGRKRRSRGDGGDMHLISYLLYGDKILSLITQPYAPSFSGQYTPCNAPSSSSQTTTASSTVFKQASSNSSLSFRVQLVRASRSTFHLPSIPTAATSFVYLHIHPTVLHDASRQFQPCPPHNQPRTSPLPRRRSALSKAAACDSQPLQLRTTERRHQRGGPANRAAHYERFPRNHARSMWPAGG